MPTRRELTKNWIRYLKNNQIAAQKSEPVSGKIIYRRPATSKDLKNFLELETEFSEEDINKAIRSIAKDKSADGPDDTGSPAGGPIAPLHPSGGPPDTMYGPGEPRQHSVPLPQQTPPKKYTNIDATDVEPRYGPRPSLQVPTRRLTPPPVSKAAQSPDETPSGKPLSKTPAAIRKRAQRAKASQVGKQGASTFSQIVSHLGKNNIKEAIRDRPGVTLSEPDVENIFRILTTTDKAVSPSVVSDPDKMRQEDLSKLKRVIRDAMTDQQRKALWRALSDA